ncbi:MAG TPA: glucoamylase family protein [Bryobacteraceae bacterium]|nr:glucoamylase family protein [Bryobacteraceae bacterium]
MTSVDVALADEPREQGAPDDLLDEIERRGCLYFFEMADPLTGMVRDRAVPGQPYAPGASSIAATGFGLSALAVADRRGYLDHEMARARVRRTLEFLCEGAEHEHGFYYHFLDSSTGKRIWKSEASSVDTAWLLCGVLHSKAYWQDQRIEKLASMLLDQADWRWMLNGGELLSHGWVPESGFLPYRWDAYCELLAMYLLALSSPRHAIPASCWSAFKRPMRDFQGIFFIDSNAPLFVHQYSHAWFDFRNRQDEYADYFHNSQRATQAHRLYCMASAKEYPWYGPDMWGVTASDSPHGYRARGSFSHPPDGTLVPCAAGGSIAFLPQICGTVLQNMKDQYGDHVWCRYGFRDAFQPQTGWYGPDVIGIDLGIMVLMTENMRSSSVWNAIMSTPEAKWGMAAAGLHAI